MSAKAHSCGRARLAFLLGGTAAIALLAGKPAHAISINDPVAAAAGGVANYFDSTNQFPSTVNLFDTDPATGSFCTGTLINARTVLTAAHCFFNNSTGVWVGGPTKTSPGLPIPSVSFAPTASASDLSLRTVSSIFVNRNFVTGPMGGPENDIAVITLANPVTAVTPVTLINTSTSITTPGTTLTMAGYGNFGTGTTACPNPMAPGNADGKRRIATTELGASGPRGGSTQPFYAAQFRDPLSPNNPNDFGLTVPVTELSGTTCHGDSGGPLFIQTAQGLEQIEVLHGALGGLGPDVETGQYGQVADWTPINLFLDWIAQNNPLREVSAAAGNFNWSNPAAWVDSVPGVVSAVPNNTIGNVMDYQADIARYYDVTLSNPGTITLDMDPTIDTLAIAGAQSQLVLPAGARLCRQPGAERGVSNAAGYELHGLRCTNRPRLGARQCWRENVAFRQLVIDCQVRRRVRFRLTDLRRLGNAALHLVSGCHFG